MRIAVLALALELAAGCSRRTQPPPPDPTASPFAHPVGFRAGTIDAAACNALVPPALATRLVFAQRTLVLASFGSGAPRGTLTIAAPTTWVVPDVRAGAVQGDEADGTFSTIMVNTFDGDADMTLDAVAGSGQISERTTRPDGAHVLVGREAAPSRRAVIGVAWDRPGHRSIVCEAYLVEALAAAVPAFVCACGALTDSEP